VSEHWQLRLRCSWSPFHWQAFLWWLQKQQLEQKKEEGHLLLLLSGYWPWISSSGTSTPGTIPPFVQRRNPPRCESGPRPRHRLRPRRPESPASPNPNNPRPLTLRARDQSSDRSLRVSLRKSRGAEKNEREAWITYQPRSGGNGGRIRDFLVLKSAQPATLASAWQGRGIARRWRRKVGRRRPCRNPINPILTLPGRLVSWRGVLRGRREEATPPTQGRRRKA
jgi:hypothetical protein